MEKRFSVFCFLYKNRLNMLIVSTEIFCGMSTIEKIRIRIQLLSTALLKRWFCTCEKAQLVKSMAPGENRAPNPIPVVFSLLLTNYQ